MKKKRVAFLASGGGSNVEAILQAMQDPGYPAEPVLIFSNNAKAGVLDKALRFGVPTAVLDHRLFPSREAFDVAVVAALQAARPDYLCLAGYMRILTPVLLDAFAGRILNIHPSLLPRHGGPGMYGHFVHEAAIKAGDKESGASVHWVTLEVDGGGILLQEQVPILPDDTADSLALRVLTAEHKIYPEALKRVCLGQV
jgi:phosphoribosylglycinamide formyltransferase-1